MNGGTMIYVIRILLYIFYEKSIYFAVFRQRMKLVVKQFPKLAIYVIQQLSGITIKNNAAGSAVSDHIKLIRINLHKLYMIRNRVLVSIVLIFYGHTKFFYFQKTFP